MTRRVLVVAHSYACETLLPARLTSAGYEVRASQPEQAAQAVAEFAPHVVIIEGGAGARGEAGLGFAVRLRAGDAHAALPLVLLYEQEDANLRALAVRLGADDYFALATPPAEIAARLEALFWRAEAGRRTHAIASLERRAEIDDFMQLLDAVRTDMDDGLTGALALIAARTPEENQTSAPPPPQEIRVLAKAYDFFNFNLRRVDSIAFYGPTLLLVYLPRKTRGAAQADLARLVAEFQATQPVGGALDTGLAAFPSDGTEIESLIERAEAALQNTRPPRMEEEAEATASVNLPTNKPTGDALSKPPSPAPGDALRKSANAAAPSSSAASRNPNAHPVPESGVERHARRDHPPTRAVRESKQGDTESSSQPAGGTGGVAIGQGTLAQAAADAAARERERRRRGAVMPRRILLTVSDPARMAQINLLLRSAAYEVRAAFDGLQAINLLRIERPDLLVIDNALYGIDGLEALRRLHRQHQGRLPLPVVLLLSTAQAEREGVREEAKELGARGFVPVPYDPDELLTCVRTVGSSD